MVSTDFSTLANKELQDFIIGHENSDEGSLVLRNRFILGVPAAAVANQIIARRKAKGKLPSFYKTAGIIYPPVINLEQSSSEFTAQYKARFIDETIPRENLTGVDLTSGFGVDSFYLSRLCKNWDCVDPDLNLLETAKHNNSLMGATNIQYHSSTAEKFIKASTTRFDFAFIDPSRRNKMRKVFRLIDCEPDLRLLLPLVFEKTKHLLLKASPLLDLHQGCVDLGCVEKIVVVSVENECKEVLFWCSRGLVSEVVIRCINLSAQIAGSAHEFTFRFSEEKATASVFSGPLTYLYEPNASILKAGAFKTVGARYGLSKLQVNTHLYTSDLLQKDFPGRIFKIDSREPDTGKFKTLFAGGKVNVLTRNYPLSPEQLKKKLKLHDGGEKYLIGFSGEKQKFLVAASRLK